MTDFKRYAIYYAPQPGALADFGASWLGWDLAQGCACPYADIAGLDAEKLTATPHKYGLHGTVKPPFFLAEGTSFDDLCHATQAHCASQNAVQLDGLVLSRLGGFLALKVTGEANSLAALAGETVRTLDRFRAPASETELARRRKSGLTARQEALLTQWGYPYVMEEFRFHITLTGRLGAQQAEATRSALAPVLEPILPTPFLVHDLCLAGEDSDGKFHLIHRYPLSA
ncbi:MAG: DUF1045 domain-containing protein [Thalassovita sp.]